jgi:hypothetical protein
MALIHLRSAITTPTSASKGDIPVAVPVTRAKIEAGAVAVVETPRAELFDWATLPAAIHAPSEPPMHRRAHTYSVPTVGGCDRP